MAIASSAAGAPIRSSRSPLPVSRFPCDFGQGLGSDFNVLAAGERAQAQARRAAESSRADGLVC